MDVNGFAILLKQCRTLSQGKHLHAELVKHGCVNNQYLGNLLIQMYGKCGNPQEARTVFDKMPDKNVLSWDMMLLAYNQNGCSRDALKLFKQMDLKPTQTAYTCAISACSTLKLLDDGRKIHKEIYFESVSVSNSLMNMYTRCRSLQEVKHVFDSMQHKDVVSWTLVITAFAQIGHPQTAMTIFYNMDLEGFVPNQVTYLAILGTCCTYEQGAKLHHRIVATGYDCSVTILNSLMSMYARLHSVGEVKKLFDSMSERATVVSWTTMISTYARCNRHCMALKLYHDMNLAGVHADAFVFVTLVDVCSVLAHIENGKKIHECILSCRFESDVVVGNSLINMYSKCRRTDVARRVFDEMVHKDSITWNSMISGYVQDHHDLAALELFREMIQEESVVPSEVTYINALCACSNTESLQDGKEVHARIVASGMENHDDVAIALVNMYGKCGSFEDAKAVFYKGYGSMNEGLWNSMIVIYMHQGRYKEAIKMFKKMDLEGVKARHVTFSSVLGTCCSTGDLKQGMQLHKRFIDSGFATDSILQSTLVNMYGKCGSLRLAKVLFDQMSTRDVLSWNTLITSYAQYGQNKEALDLFHTMIVEGLRPTEITFLSVTYACGQAGSIEKARAFMVDMVGEYDSLPTQEHYRCMIDLLGRSGRLQDAEDLIDNMPYECDSTAYTSFLAGCRLQLNADRATTLAADHEHPSHSAPYILLSNIVGLQSIK